MASFSNVVLMGNLTNDPEERSLPSGTKIVNFNIAVNTYRKGAGDNDQIATFFRCTMFGNRGDVILQNFHRGDPILVSGRDLVLREWESGEKSGTSLEVTVDNFSFVGGRGGGAGDSAPAGGSGKAAKAEAKVEVPEEGEVDLSEIPF
ncbi:MAG: single-stranded DNA-binding protein [Candidatus Nomurabacteria bacterium]|jgi:single-strand DNA-binding protein|nr:single-stranded DNA-binding protein [Candidatus Nomurabacteria bacterium]